LVKRQQTINGIHQNSKGDLTIATQIDQSLFGPRTAKSTNWQHFKTAVNDKELTGTTGIA